MLCPPLQAQVWTSNMSKIGDPWGSRRQALRSVAFARCDIYDWSGQAGAQAARVYMTASTSRRALAGFPVWGAGNPGQKWIRAATPMRHAGVRHEGVSTGDKV